MKVKKTVSFSESFTNVFSHPHKPIFLGGEPTLHPDLSLTVKKARVLGYRVDFALKNLVLRARSEISGSA